MPEFKIGIKGVGMVGTPLKDWFLEQGYERGLHLFLDDLNPRLGFNDDINRADIIFLCLPTPPSDRNRSCDTSLIFSAAKAIDGEKIVVIKSTVPPGTAEKVQKENPKLFINNNPEFLTERKADEDFRNPDRQIVGFTEKSLATAGIVRDLLPTAPFMSPWGEGTYSKIRITVTEAEFIKYAGNVMFAMKVAFANAIAEMAESMGADYEHIRAGLAADHRIGGSHLNVLHGNYRGFGGFCLPKDLSGLINFARERECSNVAEFLQATFDYNENLLGSQGLTVDDVSRHDKELESKLEKLRNRR